MSTIKDGRGHLASIRDERTILIEGRRVSDVAAHPAFRRSAQTVAGLYDYQAANPELMTFDIGGGRRANRAWQLPRSHAELVLRRKALTAWSTSSLTRVLIFEPNSSIR